VVTPASTGPSEQVFALFISADCNERDGPSSGVTASRPPRGGCESV